MEVRMNKALAVIMAIMALVCIQVTYAAEGGAMTRSIYSEIAKVTPPAKNGVQEISYVQFMKIRSSSEKYILLDVLDSESYAKGHIEGSLSLPVNTITPAIASAMLPKGSNIIVYCASFQCGASTAAANKLMGLGYKVLDYKGGLSEWQDKGNKLVSGK